MTYWAFEKLSGPGKPFSSFCITKGGDFGFVVGIKLKKKTEKRELFGTFKSLYIKVSVKQTKNI